MVTVLRRMHDSTCACAVMSSLSCCTSWLHGVYQHAVPMQDLWHQVEEDQSDLTGHHQFKPKLRCFERVFQMVGTCQAAKPRETPFNLPSHAQAVTCPNQ